MKTKVHAPFSKGRVYKHVNNTDVAFEVQGFVRRDPEGISLIVAWWNIVHKQPYVIRQHQVVWIAKEQFQNWQEFVFGVSDRKNGSVA